MEKNRKEIQKVLQTVKGNDFEEENDLISGGFLDSFDLLMFIKALEEHFDMHIPLERITLEEFNSIDSVYEIVQKIIANND